MHAGFCAWLTKKTPNQRSPKDKGVCSWGCNLQVSNIVCKSSVKLLLGPLTSWWGSWQWPNLRGGKSPEDPHFHWGSRGEGKRSVEPHHLPAGCLPRVHSKTLRKGLCSSRVKRWMRRGFSLLCFSVGCADLWTPQLQECHLEQVGKPLWF